jgi:hypothetical protein
MCNPPHQQHVNQLLRPPPELVKQVGRQGQALDPIQCPVPQAALVRRRLQFSRADVETEGTHLSPSIRPQSGKYAWYVLR